MNYNQKKIDILESELNRERKKVTELNLNTDLNWYSKFNDQREYYEDELEKKDNLIKVNQLIIDSLVSVESDLNNYINNYMVSLANLKDKKYIELAMIKFDSSLVNNYDKQLKLYKNIDARKSATIANLNMIIKNLEKISIAKSESIDNLEIINKRLNRANLISIFLILTILIFLVFAYMQKKFHKNKVLTEN